MALQTTRALSARVPTACLAIVLAVLAIGCSSGASSVEELIQRFRADCPGDNLDWDHSRAVFPAVVDVHEWIQVDQVSSSGMSGETQGDAELVIVQVSGVGTSRDHSGTELLFSPEMLAAVRWGLANGSASGVARKSLPGLSIDYASSAIVTTADGRSFFAADCRRAAVDAPLREELGQDFDRIVAQIPRTPPSELGDLMTFEEEQ